MNKVSQFSIAMVMLCVFCHADATIITLDGNNIRHTGIYTEGDFKISAPVNFVNGGNLGERSHLSAIGFSGDYMETWNTAAVFNLEEVSGKSFDLVGLDVGSYFTNNGGLAAWTFTGFSGNKIVFSLVNSELLGNQLLNWSELTRFSIASSRGSSASSFDNIEVFISPIATVNEPQSALLITLSLIGLGLRCKNNNKV
jgi:hypothetical protein